MAASEQQDDGVARELLETSLTFERRAMTLLNLSALDVRRRRYEAAWSWIEQALEVEPGNVRALVAAGKLLLSRDRDAEAEAYFERAQQLCPSRCGGPLEGLGIIAARAGQYDEARSHLIEALRREPWLEDARTNLRLLERVTPR
jgi:tetratricopeptide (TPR) repeat protein